MDDIEGSNQIRFLQPNTETRGLLMLVLLTTLPTLSLAALRSGEQSPQIDVPFARDAGPIIVVKGGERNFAIPKGYFTRRESGNADKDQWALEILWPDFSPWRENNRADERSFHAPGGGRQISISIHFRNKKNQSTFLDRLIGEQRKTPLEQRSDPGLDLPADTKEKRIKGAVKFGLQPYYVDFGRVVKYLNRNGKKIALDDMDEFDKARWQDWYIRRDRMSRVATLIECDSREVPDPPDVEVTGKKLVRVPHCTHEFLVKPIGADVELFYRRVYLYDWKRIELNVRDLILKFESAPLTNRLGR